MDHIHALHSLVAQARRRWLVNLVSEQITVGAIAAFAGAILLLVVGTEILNWYWLVLLFCAGAGISAWRTLRFLPSPYSVAQHVDHRLGLHDAISTAFHFAEPGRADAVSQPLLYAQREQAVQLASTVIPAHAVPWRVPRQALPMGALALVTLTLFAVRYGVNGSLDLRQPLIAHAMDFFRPRPELAQRNKQPRSGQIPLTDAQAAGEDDPNHPNVAPDEVTAENGQADTRSPNASSRLDAKPSAQPPQGDKMDDAADKADPGDSKQSASNANSQAKSQSSSAAGEKNDKSGGEKSGSPENTSLMDKMKDAMANLLSKFKMQAPGQERAQAASNPSDEKGESSGSNGQPGKQGEGQSNGQNQQASESDASKEGASQDASASGKGNSSQKGKGQSDRAEGNSAAGSDDGAKAIKDAEQLAAMGKLSELFGKRAQTVTGDMMVEVSGSKQQQLKTAYADRNASHKDSGAEIHRDDIPLEFQQYVMQYFEQVRKGETTPAAKQK